MEYSSKYEVTTCHSWEKNWIDKNKETRSYLTGRINEELGSLINTIRATILKGKLLVKILPKITQMTRLMDLKCLILDTCES